MGSVAQIKKTKSFRVLFTDYRNGKRAEIILSHTCQKNANIVLYNVENILANKLSGQSMSDGTAVWIKSLSQQLRKKLAIKGLVDDLVVSTLGDFVESIFLARKDVENSTIEVWRQPVRNLIDYFGKNVDMKNISAGKAEKFYHDLASKKLAHTTLRKRIDFCKNIFNSAIKHGIISENPFKSISPPSGDNSVKMHYVPENTIREIMVNADPNWRVIIALCRFGGLRCPSEVLSLRWDAVDWRENSITVESPKTKRYPGMHERRIPIFKALRPFLLEAQAAAGPDKIYVVGGSYLEKCKGNKIWRNCNIRKPMELLVKKAGYDLWTRLFHNLRSSCETDLLDQQFPLKAVAKWFGHSVEIAMRHYAQVTEKHFSDAVGSLT